MCRAAVNADRRSDIAENPIRLGQPILVDCSCHGFEMPSRYKDKLDVVGAKLFGERRQIGHIAIGAVERNQRAVQVGCQNSRARRGASC